MLFLILAILSSASVTVVMRLSEGRIHSRMSMFSMNYVVCTLMSVCLSGGSLFKGEGLGLTVLLGVITGIIYLLTFVLQKKNLQMNGMILTGTFMKLGVLIPTLMAIIVFGEVPGIARIAGICIAVAAILIMNLKGGDNRENRGNGMLWLLFLLVSGGMADGMMNIYDKTAGSLRALYLALTFFTALLIALGLAVREGKKPAAKDLLFGCCLGIPNYLSSLFMLSALKTLPAVVVFPVFSVGTILVMSVVGLAAFKEKLGKRECIALGLILAALVLINI